MRFRTSIVLGFLFLAASAVVSRAATVTVDCDARETLGAALAVAAPGDTLLVTGTCHETVVVRTGDLVIDGQGAATLDARGAGANVVTVDGARNLTLRKLTLRNGGGGILAINDANFTVEDTVVTGNRSHGIEIIRSTARLLRVRSEQNGRVGVIANRTSLAEVTDCSLTNNLSGLVVFSNAVVRFFGTNDMSDNRTQGMTAGLGGAIFSIGPVLLMNDNGAEGFLVLQQGNVQVIGGAIEANRNAGDGIRVAQNSSLTLGVEGFAVAASVEANDNAGHGVAVESASHLLVTPSGGLISRGNGASGVSLDDASNATLEGASLVANRDADLLLGFGSTASLEGNTIGRIACDRTALLRGDARCTGRGAGAGDDDDDDDDDDGRPPKSRR